MKENDPIEALTRLTGVQRSALKKLGIATVRDLLYHFPSRYESSADVRTVSELRDGETATVYGKFTKLEMRRSWRTKVPIAEGSFSDGSGTVRVTWFHQPYLAKMVPVDTLVRLRGKVSGSDGRKYIANPVVEKALGRSPATGEADGLPFMPARQSPSGGGETKDGLPAMPAHAGHAGLLPVYPESAGVTSLWFYHAVKRALEQGVLDSLEESLPEDILTRYHLPNMKSAMVWIHQPKTEKDAEAARKRFAFEEVFLIQIARGIEREGNKEKRAFEIDADERRVAGFVKSFPFEPTAGQKKAIGEILADFLEPYPMHRLLEGDVGSGKTAVAAAAAYAVVTSRPQGQDFGNLQIGYMCPTEILAKQHFATFTSFFAKHPIQIGLITSSGCYKFPSKVNPKEATSISRPQLLKWVANGEIPIVIGTHALIQKSVIFKHLAFVIVDEQHRFGVAQRYALARGKTQIQEPQIDADRTTAQTNTESFLYKDLSYAIRHSAFEIHNALGPGHKEVVYQNALAAELEKRSIAFSREKKIDVLYRNKKVGIYQPDFVIDEKIIVELKTLPFTGQQEKKQLWNYLKGSPYRLALLINFGTQKVEIMKVVYDTARNLRTSASDTRSSAEMNPHLLSMTATPIPRTLALTLYGDLDLTILDELPAGRKPVQTDIVTPRDRDRAYEKIRSLVKSGRQAYVICPRIDEPDPAKSLALQARSVASETKRLSAKIFPDLRIEKLHSKMKPKDKEEVMGRFTDGKIDILVATSVVEVGVNVPNATVIMIEGAERFGLAQLHQLRGRVMRSSHEPYCFLMVDRGGENARLKAIKEAKNGFELAEKDLAIRGAGELYGARQWGISDIGMNALQNLKLVEAARKEAFALIDTDRALARHPRLRKLAKEKASSLHFE